MVLRLDSIIHEMCRHVSVDTRIIHKLELRLRRTGFSGPPCLHTYGLDSVLDSTL